MHSARFRIIQGGMSVAEVEHSDRARALQEALHYAVVYSQDGPVLIEERYHNGRRWAWRDVREAA